MGRGSTPGIDGGPVLQRMRGGSAFSGRRLCVPAGSLSFGAVPVLRSRRPGLPRPFRVPLYPLLPVLYILASGMIMVALSMEKPVEAFGAFFTLSGGLPLYWVMNKWPRVSII